MKRYILFFASVLTLILFGSGLNAQVTGSFTDARDNTTYNYVIVGESVWMAENLAYKADTGCYTYRNADSNIVANGYLYTWEAATNVCPAGWHLPSDVEWQYLEKYLGMKEKVLEVKGFRASEDFYSKALIGGSSDLNLTMSGWSVSEKKFYHLSKRGSYWTSSVNRDTEGWYRYFDNHKGIYRLYERKTFGFSVRCVKDQANTPSMNKGQVNNVNKGTQNKSLATNNAAVVHASQKTREFTTPQIDTPEKDNTPPTIKIISPQTSRGTINETSNKTIQITGKVADKSGIFEVYVNRFEAVVGSDGSFQAVVPLAYGENKIVVRVTDLSFNIRRDTLTVVRKAGAVEKIPVTAGSVGIPVTAGLAGIAAQPTIEWRKPNVNGMSTSTKNYNLETCIKTKEKIMEVKITLNSVLFKKYDFGEIVFRGECDFIVDELIELKNGENEIIVSVTTERSQYKETRIVNYNFIDAKYYALIIGVNEYDVEIGSLSKPIEDGQELMDVLLKDYTFEKKNIIFLKNPTKADIISTLHKMRSYIKPEDNLLIFYAGHGYWDAGMKVGYWLPTDSEKDNPVNWFSNTDLTNYLSAIDTKHTLLIADACFSGGIFKTRKAFSEKQVIERLYQLPSRKAITSGTLKEVPDESVFIEYLVKRLEDNESKYLSTEELFSSLRTAVMNNSSNIPQFGTIKNTGDEGGDFIFIRR